MGRVKRICVFEHSLMAILTAYAQPFRGARDLAFCPKVPLDSLLVWASSGGSGETARMRRLAWTFAARIGDKNQICLRRPKWKKDHNTSAHITTQVVVDFRQANSVQVLLHTRSFIFHMQKHYTTKEFVTDMFELYLSNHRVLYWLYQLFSKLKNKQKKTVLTDCWFGR